jgi:hypothetical protein
MKLVELERRWFTGLRLVLLTMLLSFILTLLVTVGTDMAAALLATELDGEPDTRAGQAVAPGAPLAEVIGPQTWVVLLCKFAERHGLRPRQRQHFTRHRDR